MNSFLFLRNNNCNKNYYIFGSTDDLLFEDKTYSQNELNKGFFEYVWQFPIHFAHLAKHTIYKKYFHMFHQNNKKFCHKNIVKYINNYLRENNETFIALNKKQIAERLKK